MKEKGFLEVKLDEGESLDDHCFVGYSRENISKNRDPFQNNKFQGVRIVYEIIGRKTSL